MRYIFIESILGFRSTQQYTLGMHLLLKILEYVLVTMFLIGGFGSAFVIVISFVEDLHELYPRSE
jgi:hypothetical protein